MELQTYFNELSCDPSPLSAEEAYERIKVLMELLRALYSIGIKHFRISDDKYVCGELYQGCTLQEIIKETKNKAYIDFFYATFTAPFLDDDVKAKVEQNCAMIMSFFVWGWLQLILQKLLQLVSIARLFGTLWSI